MARRHRRNKLARLLKARRTFDSEAASRALARRAAVEQWRARRPAAGSIQPRSSSSCRPANRDAAKEEPPP